MNVGWRESARNAEGRTGSIKEVILAVLNSCHRNVDSHLDTDIPDLEKFVEAKYRNCSPLGRHLEKLQLER